MEMIFTNGCDERFIPLCCELDAYLNDLVGGETQRKQYVQYNSPEAVSDVLLLLVDGQAIACGGYKPFDDSTAEIKRVFTKPAFRGHGYAQTVMELLEERALTQGYTRLILETGRLLETAIRMYAKLGFYIIDNYGQYRCMPDSVCMEKPMTPKPQA